MNFYFLTVKSIMSILFASNDGWIISHLDYINSIYKSVEDEHENKTLRFNEILFKVNSQYLRQNQIESQNNAEANIKSLKKRKRSKSQTLPPEVLQQVLNLLNVYHLMNLVFYS